MAAGTGTGGWRGAGAPRREGGGNLSSDTFNCHENMFLTTGR